MICISDKEQIAPIDQTNGVNPYQTHEVNPYLTCAGGSVTFEVAFGANNEDKISENESFLPYFSFSPENEEERFNLIPYDKQGGDVFDFVFPPEDEANGTSLFLDDSNGIGDQSAFAFLPTNCQAEGVNLTDASGCGSHAPAFSPSN